MKILPNSKIYKIAVTGGAGFIGSHIIDSFLEEGHHVISLDNYSSGKRRNLANARLFDENFTEIDIDISSSDARLEDAFDGVDFVFNQAASKMNISAKNPEQDLRVNGLGTLKLLFAASKAGCKKFVHASTGSVYGEPIIFPTDEAHPLNPVSFYGVSKIAGEKYVRLFSDQTDMETVILRYFHVYGPRQESNNLGGVVAIFIRSIIEGIPIRIFGDGRQIRSFTYVKDIVNINRFVTMEKNLNGLAFNCASGIRISINELAHLVKKIMNVPNHPIIYEESKVGDIKNFDVNNFLLKSRGFEWKTEFENGLIETIKFFIDESRNEHNSHEK